MVFYHQNPIRRTLGLTEHVYEKRYTNGRKTLFFFFFKNVAKGGGIHRIKQHLVGVKKDIGSCKLVPPVVRFQMENSLQDFVNSNKAAQEAYEYRNPYGSNVSQFERDIVEGEDEIQEIQNPMATSSGKRKKINNG